MITKMTYEKISGNETATVIVGSMEACLVSVWQPWGVLLKSPFKRTCCKGRGCPRTSSCCAFGSQQHSCWALALPKLLPANAWAWLGVLGPTWDTSNAESLPGDSPLAWQRLSQLCCSLRLLLFCFLSPFTGVRSVAVLKALPAYLYFPSFFILYRPFPK